MRRQEEQITPEEKADKYAEHLMHSPQLDSVRAARRYLVAHGFDDRGYMAKQYQLGVVNPAEPADERFDGMLAIPYQTRAGIVAWKFRCLADHDCKAYSREVDSRHAKYGAPHGQEPWIYNPEAFFAADDTIGVAEGEIDAIVATEILGIPTIGIPGVETWTSNRKIWKRTLEDYDNVLIFVDGDGPSQVHPEGAGLAFARAVQQDVGSSALLVRCPPGEDVASMVASGQGDILQERAGL